MEKNLMTSKIAYNFTALTDEEATIDIYDVIAGKSTMDYWTGEKGTEVTPTDFKEKLDATTAKNITIRMNSMGGEVIAATVIAGAIQEARNCGKKVKCQIDGVCASAAVQIATACDEISIHPSALMMIHNPMLFLFDYYDELGLEKKSNYLKTTKNSIINFYEEKTGLSRQKLSNMMDEETWMTGKEAVDKGFADKLMFDEAVKDDDVINRIHNACVNTVIKLPETYQAAINQLRAKKGEDRMEVINTAQELMNQYPDLTNQIRNEAMATAKNEGIEEGIKQERARLQAIDELGEKVSADLINKAKYETFESAENVAIEALKTGAFIQTGVVNAMMTETDPAKNVAGIVTEPTNNPVANKAEAVNKAAEIAKNHFKKIGKAGE